MFLIICIAKMNDYHDYLKESEGEILNISRGVKQPLMIFIKNWGVVSLT